MKQMTPIRRLTKIVLWWDDDDVSFDATFRFSDAEDELFSITEFPKGTPTREYLENILKAIDNPLKSSI